MQDAMFEAIRVYENLKKDEKSRGVYEVAVSTLILSLAILLLAIVTVLLFNKLQFNCDFSVSFPSSL